MIRLSALLLAGSAAAADPAAAAIEQLRAANQARGELAREAAAWADERARLHAAIAAAEAESARLGREAAAARTRRDAERARLAALGEGDEADALLRRLAEAGTRWRARLDGLGATLPPGVVPAAAAGAEPFDDAVAALEAAERAASQVAVAVAVGRRARHQQAARLLVAGGACAWWLAFDGSAAGSVRCRDGAVEFTDEPDPQRRAAIAAAFAQIEGREPPSLLALPDPGARP